MKKKSVHAIAKIVRSVNEANEIKKKMKIVVCLQAKHAVYHSGGSIQLVRAFFSANDSLDAQ